MVSQTLQQITLDASIILQIADIMTQFTASTATITKDSSSGIGYTVDVTIPYDVAMPGCILTIPIVTSADW